MAIVYDTAIAPVGCVEPSGPVDRADGRQVGLVAADRQVSAQNARLVGRAD
jgi:hypothetical protein